MFFGVFQYDLGPLKHTLVLKNFVSSVNSTPGYIRAHPDIRAFGENRPDNAQIFVILPGSL